MDSDEQIKQKMSQINVNTMRDSQMPGGLNYEARQRAGESFDIPVVYDTSIGRIFHHGNHSEHPPRGYICGGITTTGTLSLRKTGEGLYEITGVSLPEDAHPFVREVLDLSIQRYNADPRDYAPPPVVQPVRKPIERTWFDRLLEWFGVQ